MAVTTAVLNGVRNIFGPVAAADNKIPSKATKLKTEIVAVDFRYDDLPTNSTTDEGILVIPAKSFLVSARLEVLEAFAGGTSYDIGLVQTDGTAIDADGLFAALALASINGVGKWAVGAGALVGAVSSLTLDGQIKVAATGTFTAGRARLIVEYIPSAI